MHGPTHNFDHRMESFVAYLGDVPPGAHRLEDAEARHHGASWIRRLIGKGLAGSYVIGYAAGDDWWTYCFERTAHDMRQDSAGLQAWTVEAYDSTGHSSSDTFLYARDAGLWLTVLTAEPLAQRVQTRDRAF